MGSSQSVVTAMEAVLKQRDIKIANQTLRNFVKEADRVAPWYACSGSLTLASWDKLGRDLVRRMEDGDLRQGTTAIWKLIKNCLEDKTCQTVVAEGRSVLEEVQDSMSETERSERLGARRKKWAQYKENGPPGKSADKGEYFKEPRYKENGPPGKSADKGVYFKEPRDSLFVKKSDKGTNLYPV